jgi:hypothetical protein
MKAETAFVVPIALLTILCPLLAQAVDLVEYRGTTRSAITIENVELVVALDDASETYVRFDLRWDNAWNNDRNHDAAWVFVKRVGDGDPKHVKIVAEGHRIALL